MEERSVEFLVKASGGVLRQGCLQASFTGVSTDSRRLAVGQAFVALRGRHYDGHAFVGEAVGRGAAAVVVERGRVLPSGLAGAVIEVDECRAALGRLGAVWRSEFNLPVVAVAGSNGKTTTKELVSSVLGQRWRTLRSPASYNNEVGVPLTLLELGVAHEALVVEVGTNHPGELAPLLRMIRPRYGLLSSLGREHLEHFGSFAGVVEEEGWLAESLPADGCLLVNGDSPGLEAVVRRSAAPVVRVGMGQGNDWRGEVRELGMRGVVFGVRGPDPAFEGEYRVPFPGRHQVGNALLGLVLGARLGLTREEVARGLAACPAPARRMEVWQAGGVWVMDDAYNANADSMWAALEALRDVPCAGRRVAVLGEMTEVGEGGLAMHAEVGRGAGEMGVDWLVLVGRMATVMGAAARAVGLDRTEEFAEVEAAARAVVDGVRPGDVVLVKASRLVRLERVSEALRGMADAA
jgi:UDP-N-acetylmuramoyl-tripeptide--D-alanyl-D-alanine ligase